MKIALALVIALLAAPVAAAQEPPLPSDTVARVGQRAILKADFDHWLLVATASAGQAEPPAAGTKEYAQLRDQVMQLLISFTWIELEARDRGIVISKAKIRASLREQKRQSFPNERAWQRFLASSHQTEADIMQRIRLDLLSNRLRDRVIAHARTPEGQQKRLDRFVKRFTRKWKARTVCGEGYSTSDCGRTSPPARGCQTRLPAPAASRPATVAQSCPKATMPEPVASGFD
jgi:foldase protein PrsA